MKFYENQAYGPRARFISVGEFYNTDDEILRRVRQSDFDPEGVVESQQGKSGRAGLGRTMRTEGDLMKKRL